MATTINIEIPKPVKSTDVKEIVKYTQALERALQQIKTELQRLQDEKADA